MWPTWYKLLKWSLIGKEHFKCSCLVVDELQTNARRLEALAPINFEREFTMQRNKSCPANTFSQYMVERVCNHPMYTASSLVQYKYMSTKSERESERARTTTISYYCTVIMSLVNAPVSAAKHAPLRKQSKKLNTNPTLFHAFQNFQVGFSCFAPPQMF